MTDDLKGLSGEALLAEAAVRFREYENNHRAKALAMKPDGVITAERDAVLTKAERNAEIAGRIEQYLSKAGEAPVGEQREAIARISDDDLDRLKWHFDREIGHGHCGESTSEAISRGRQRDWADRIILSLSSPSPDQTVNAGLVEMAQCLADFHTLPSIVWQRKWPEMAAKNKAAVDGHDDFPWSQAMLIAFADWASAALSTQTVEREDGPPGANAGDFAATLVFRDLDACKAFTRAMIGDQFAHPPSTGSEIDRGEEETPQFYNGMGARLGGTVFSDDPAPQIEQREAIARLTELAEDAASMTVNMAMHNAYGAVDGPALAADLLAILALASPSPDKTVNAGLVEALTEAETALQYLSCWRAAAEAYDEDMGHPTRSFDAEDWQNMEDYAMRAASAASHALSQSSPPGEEEQGVPPGASPAATGIEPAATKGGAA